MNSRLISLIKNIDKDKNSYSLLNQVDENAFYINEIENAIDSLETALTFLTRSDNLKWKWVAIALHHSLYCFCISALVNGNYENVLSYEKGEDNKTYCQFDKKDKWRKSKIIRRPNKIGGYIIEWNEIEGEPPNNSKQKYQKPYYQLIGFWTALARVQDSYYWMGRLCCTNALTLTEEEWQSIEFLVSEIRNGLIHFIPKTWKISILSIKKTCFDVLRIIEFLALKSFAIVYNEDQQDKSRIETAITKMYDLLKE